MDKLQQVQKRKIRIGKESEIISCRETGMSYEETRDIYKKYLWKTENKTVLGFSKGQTRNVKCTGHHPFCLIQHRCLKPKNHRASVPYLTPPPRTLSWVMLTLILDLSWVFFIRVLDLHNKWLYILPLGGNVGILFTRSQMVHCASSPINSANVCICAASDGLGIPFDF